MWKSFSGRITHNLRPDTIKIILWTGLVGVFGERFLKPRPLGVKPIRSLFER